MDESPIEQMIHQSARGVADVKSAQDEAPSWGQAATHPGLQTRNNSIIEVINQADGIDQVLGFQLQLLTADTKMQQVAAFQAHHRLQPLANQPLTDELQGLLIHIHEGEAHLGGCRKSGVSKVVRGERCEE